MTKRIVITSKHLKTRENRQQAHKAAVRLVKRGETYGRLLNVAGRVIGTWKVLKG